MAAILRQAGLPDEQAVGEVLQASYPASLAGAYDADLLAHALPLMVRANPALLRTGTYYLAETADGQPVGCGGWTLARPHAPHEKSDTLDPALAHIRHFATHPGWVRQGIGRALFDRCAEEAKAAGAQSFECYSTLAAESFYQVLGFKTVEAITLALAPGVSFPSLRMVRALT